MNRKIFCSYSHVQKEWVHDRLLPCLKASGVNVLIDTDRFRLGHEILGQMDALQDQADASLFVLSPDYMASKACQHEMQRAISKDPGFTGRTIPLRRVACDLPPKLRPKSKLRAPLCVDLCDDHQCEPWQQLLDACGGDLGTDAPHWLSTRDEMRRMLQRDESVNMLVIGQPKWRELVNHLCEECSMHQVDLHDAQTIVQSGLLASMLGKTTLSSVAHGHDLIAFQNELKNRAGITRVALTHLDRVRDVERHYENALFSTLRFLIELRKLTLLMVSRCPAIDLVPINLWDSPSLWQTVELKGRP